MHYYQFNIGDYHSHTSHLDELEDLAYRRMLDWIYLHESPLPDSIEQIARLIRMRTHSDSIANVLQEFFERNEYGYTQKTAMEQIEAYKSKSEKAKASAKARWSKKPNKSDANALQTQSEGNANHKPITNNHNNNVCDKSHALEKEVIQKGFDYFWKKWRELKNQVNGSIGVKKEALTQWQKMFKDYEKQDFKTEVDQICKHSAQKLSTEYAGNFNDHINLHAVRYLKREEWK